MFLAFKLRATKTLMWIIKLRNFHWYESVFRVFHWFSIRFIHRNQTNCRQTTLLDRYTVTEEHSFMCAHTQSVCDNLIINTLPLASEHTNSFHSSWNVFKHTHTKLQHCIDLKRNEQWSVEPKLCNITRAIYDSHLNIV